MSDTGMTGLGMPAPATNPTAQADAGQLTQPPVPVQQAAPAAGPAMPAASSGSMSIAELAGIAYESVEAVRFSTLPIMAGNWEIIRSEMKATDNAEYPFRIEIECKIIGVSALTVANPTDDRGAIAAELVAEGASHVQRNNISAKEPAKGLGFAKAFIDDTGFVSQPGMSFQQALTALIGHRFPGKITHRPDKNDAEKKWADLRPEKAS